MIINCKLCGIAIEKKGNNTKYCKSCFIKRKRECSKEWARKNPEKKRKYYQKNKEKIKKKREANLEEYRRKARESYENNKKERRGYKKIYYKNHKEEICKKHRKNYYKNREKNKDKKREYMMEYNKKPVVKKRNKEWRKRNKDKRREIDKMSKKKNRIKINFRAKIRRKKDKEYNTKIRLGALFRKILRIYTKKGKIMSSKKYGIDYKAIIEHLKPFPKDLHNYEIHHIKPLYTFNFIHKDGSTDLKEVKEAFAPKNHKLVTIEEHKEIHRNLNQKKKKRNI